LLRPKSPFDKLRDQSGAQQKIGRAATAASEALRQRPNKIKSKKAKVKRIQWEVKY